MTARQIIDKFDRIHDYIRISVTDRCNLRCVYCMPEEGMTFLPPQDVLSYEEITEVVRVLAGMGVRKVRLTGGEPLTRPNLEELIAAIHTIEGIEDIALTTNGIYLAPKAKLFKEAGLNRLNISLDSLQADRFAKITRGGDFHKVMESIDTCLALGYNPIKLNVVLIKGGNDDEILDFLSMTAKRKVIVRFIEYMPIGHHDQSWMKGYVPLSTVLEQCKQAGLDVQPVEDTKGNGPAEYYKIEGAPGRFGLIHPVSDHFCASCNRLRLTADGHVKPCLYWDDEWNVRPLIGDDEKLREMILRAIEAKPETHEMAKALNQEEQSHQPTTRRMSQIGG